MNKFYSSNTLLSSPSLFLLNASSAVGAVIAIGMVVLSHAVMAIHTPAMGAALGVEKSIFFL